jgi:hypothetical protein
MTFDLEYRPATYWDDKAINANIKGEWRRRAIQAAEESGAVDEIPADLFSDALPEPMRAMVGRIHPSLMGGEYLPDYLPNEVEIARISLRSTTGDVISVRARPATDGIHFRIADEYESDYVISPEVSPSPLTLAELISLIERADSGEGDREGIGLTESYRNHNICSEAREDYEAVRDFVRVESAFYPDLFAFFEEQADQWLERKLKELEGGP